MALLTATAWIVALGGPDIALAQFPGLPGTPDINSPAYVAFSPSGGLLATANPETYSAFGGTGIFPTNELGTVSMFRVGAGGQLGEIIGSPFHSGGMDPVFLAWSPDGKLLAVANYGGDPATVGGPPEGEGVAVFSVSPGGVPRQVAFRRTSRPVSVAWSSTNRLAVANAGDNSVSVFSVTAGGQLHEVGSAQLGAHPCNVAPSYVACAMPTWVAFSSDGEFLAVSNSGDNNVSVFRVEQNGSLALLSNVPLPTKPTPCTPIGSFCPGGVYDRPAYPAAVSFGSGGLLAVLSPGQTRVYMFSVSAGGVTREQTTDLPDGSRPDAMSFNSSGGLLAVTSYSNNTATVFSVGAGGALAQVGAGTADTGPWSVAFSSTGLLAVANSYPHGTVSVFSVSAGGALTEVTGSPFALRVPRGDFIWARIPGTPVDVSPGLPARPVFNVNSNLLAVPINAGRNGVAMVSVAPNGTSTSVPGSIFQVGPAACGGTGGPACAEPFSAAFNLDGQLLATANNGNHTVSLFTVGAGGVLSGEKEFRVGPKPPACSETFISEGQLCWEPYSVAIDPDGYVAVASTSRVNHVSGNPDVKQEVSIFSVEDGQLTHLRDVSFDCSSVNYHYNNIAFNSNGTLLAASCSEPSAVWVFKVGATADLTRPPGNNTPFMTGDNTATVAFNPAGNLLAVPSVDSDSVWVLSVVDKATGELAKGAVEATGQRPYGADFGQATGPLGELLATADYQSHTISLFSVGAGPQGTAASAAADSGRARPSRGRSADPLLTQVPGSPIFTGQQYEPDSITFSPNGHFMATGDQYVFLGFSIWAPTGPLEIRKTPTPRKVSPGQVLHYTLTVHNPNPYPVTGTVTDDLGDILDKGTYRHDVRATVPTVTVNEAGRLLTWRGNLAIGQTVTIHYSVKIHGDASGIVTNRVTGPPNAICLPPAAPELPCQTETPIVPPKGPGADLSLTKIASTQSTHPGAQVLYTLVVHNHGPGTATGVIVEDPVPAGLFLHSARPTQGSCTLTATDLTCRLGSIVSGGGAMVLVEATVATDARGTITNLANVHGRQRDPHPDNNTASSTITVTLWPKPPAPPERTSNLVVAKRAPRTVTQGQTYRYTITVTSKGPDSASDVTLVDAARLPFRVVSIRPSRGRCQTGPPIRCALGTLRKGARVTVTITARATTAGNQVNAVTVMSPSWDPAVGSNLARAATTIRPAPVPAPPPFTG